MKDSMRFPWEDPSVSIFKVWGGQPELAWAQKAWAALERQGLTLFSNELERTRVLIRGMALGTIYREFCDLAFGEAWEPEYLIWADEMGLNSFRVAQLIGDDSEFGQDEDVTESSLLNVALYFLIDEERESIHAALCKEFDGESMLFVSLWNSIRRDEPLEDDPFDDDNYDEGDCSESAEDILNSDITGEKLQAYSWICEGMPRVR